MARTRKPAQQPGIESRRLILVTQASDAQADVASLRASVNRLAATMAGGAFDAADGYAAEYEACLDVVQQWQTEIVTIARELNTLSNRLTTFQEHAKYPQPARGE